MVSRERFDPYRILLIGNVAPQTTAVASFLAQSGHTYLHAQSQDVAMATIEGFKPDLIVVAGWRHIIIPTVLAFAPTVGFHSARLPEYPGRAPVPWALLRGDEWTENTMFYLDEGVDSGDIIDRRRIRLEPDMTPELVYQHMARTCVEMLDEHLPALLAGTAPRTPQDMSKRGPLTTAEGWDLWRASLSSQHIPTTNS